jgi:hypothetical protein
VAASWSSALPEVIRDASARKHAERTNALLACLERICRHGGWRLGHLLMLQKGEGARLAPGASIWMVDDSDRVRYADFIAASATYRYDNAGGAFASLILREKRPLWLADAAQFPAAGRLALLRAKGMRSAFGFPVVSGGDSVALLEFFSEAARPVDALLLKGVSELAAQRRGKARATAASDR